IKNTLQRMPLLVFDQFDDYQAAHRSQFLPGRRRTWIDPRELTRTNRFWRLIKRLFDRQVVRCLFVTRTDASGGLKSVRFLDPPVYRLARLRAAYVEPLLTQLTTTTSPEPPVVSQPEHGWYRLRRRLADDLSQDGAVLPVQMKVAFQGLETLGALTERDYKRAGGLAGLEAGYIEWHTAS